MGKLGKMRRDYAKAQFAKLTANEGQGAMVSDEEKKQFEAGAVNRTQQAIGAQQQGLARAAMAQTGAGPQVAGGALQAAADMGKASEQATVRASGEARQYADQLSERRKAAAMADIRQTNEDTRANTARTFGMGMQAVDMASNAIQGVGGGLKSLGVGS